MQMINIHTLKFVRTAQSELCSIKCLVIKVANIRLSEKQMKYSFFSHLQKTRSSKDD